MMKNNRIVYKGLCLTLAAFLLVPYGSVAVAATQERTVVSSQEIYSAMSARASQDAAARKAVQKLLAHSEVRRVAARAGLDLARAQAAVAVLSGVELQAVAEQAQRAEEALAGGSRIVITSTMAIIGLLVLIIILVA